MYIIIHTAPGTAKKPQVCESDTECLDSEACYMGQCENLCSFATVCAPNAKCNVIKHRPVCSCPPGYEGNPATKCYQPKLCKTNLITNLINYRLTCIIII